MCSAEAVVTVDCHRLNLFALSIYWECCSTLNYHINISLVFHTNELVERKIALNSLILVILSDSSGVNTLVGTIVGVRINAEGRQHFLVALLLNLELRQDEAELS